MNDCHGKVHMMLLGLMMKLRISNGEGNKDVEKIKWKAKERLNAKGEKSFGDWDTFPFRWEGKVFFLRRGTAFWCEPLCKVITVRLYVWIQTFKEYIIKTFPTPWTKPSGHTSKRNFNVILLVETEMWNPSHYSIIVFEWMCEHDCHELPTASAVNQQFQHFWNCRC